MNGVESVISDGHEGIQESVTRLFIGAALEFCHVHFMRNLMKLIPGKRQLSIMQIVKLSLENESLTYWATLLLRIDWARHLACSRDGIIPCTIKGHTVNCAPE